MSAFPSPTAGHEDPRIGNSSHWRIIRKPSATLVWLFDYDFVLMNLVKGDIGVFEVDRRPHDECLALVEYCCDTLPVQLYWRQDKWFAVTDEKRGRVTEDMMLVGVARCFIKDLLVE